MPSGIPLDTIEWIRLEHQVIRTPQGETALAVQVLPRPVWQAFDAMNQAMQAELGKRLVVGSGYRSHAHQAYVFLSVLPAFGYSIRETKRYANLPGRSEHSLPERQGIDFISQDGVDRTFSNPQAFASLPEYRWLQAHAARFGFVLSHPRDTREAAFSPWHWRYEKPGGSH